MPLDNSGNDLRKYMGDQKVFIETGTYHGDGIASALTAGFEKIYSVELSSSLAERCRKRFENDDRVSVVCGSSDEYLPQLLGDIDEPFLLWLDAHVSNGCIGKLMYDYLPVELESIMDYKDKFVDSVIMIDDMGYYIDDKEFCSRIENMVMDLKPNGTLEYYRPSGTPYVILVSK
jgi:hypothetical protein